MTATYNMSSYRVQEDIPNYWFRTTAVETILARAAVATKTRAWYIVSGARETPA